MTSDRDDAIAMWCDLLTANLHAENASLAVTRRAEIYMRAAGLPLDRVFDALAIDEQRWTERVAALRASELANKAAYARGRDQHQDHGS